MKPCRELGVLATHVRRRLARHHQVVDAAIQFAPSLHTEQLISYVSIDLLNSWVNFARSYYLSCCMGARTAVGLQVNLTTRPASLTAAIGLAVHQHRPKAQPRSDGSWNRRDEPPWHSSLTLLSLAAFLGFSNQTGIQSAFSIQTRVFADLPVFRNFYGHRNEQTQKAASKLGPQYGISPLLRPTAILLGRPSGRPQALIHEWIVDMSLAAEIMCT